MDQVDQLSVDALAEARVILAEGLHQAGQSVDSLSDEEIVAMIDNVYEGGATKLQSDMDSDWA